MLIYAYGKIERKETFFILPPAPPDIINVLWETAKL